MVWLLVTEGTTGCAGEGIKAEGQSFETYDVGFDSKLIPKADSITVLVLC